MPTRTGQDSKGCYARWGRHGKKYYYACGDTSARKYAVSKADRQGRAVRASGWTGNAVLTAKRRRGKLDPSRTYALRKRFVAEMRRRTNALVREVYAQVVTRDAYGLIEKEKQAARLALHAGYAFATDAQKVTAFRQWLQQQVDDKVLSVQGGKAGEPWTSQYVQSAYKQGAYRSYASKYKTEAERRAPGLGVTRGEFIKEAFFSPEMMSKVELLSTRAYESLKGITTAMASEMNRVFATALVEGRGAAKTARMLRDTVGNLTNRRALALARTEVIYAHAEGQLDGYAQLGVDTVKAEVEWSTANDGAVCEECGSMEGQVYRVSEAHGMIPLHPNCRCAWVPVEESKMPKVAGEGAPAGQYEAAPTDVAELKAEKTAATRELDRLKRDLMDLRLKGQLGDSEVKLLARIRETKSRLDTVALKLKTAKPLKAVKTAKQLKTAKAIRPTAAKIKPVTAKVKPVTAKVKPVAAKIKPVAAEIKPVVTGVKPSAEEVKRAIADITPRKLVAKGTTRYNTAEEYRQALVSSYEKLQGPARNLADAHIYDDALRKEMLSLENKLNTLTPRTAVYKDTVRQLNALEDKLSANFKLMQTHQDEMNKLVEAGRAILEEKNFVKLASSSGIEDMRAVENVLRWIPDLRLSAYERARVANVSVRISPGNSYYQVSRNSITLSAENQRTLAHEFGHQVSLSIDGFDDAQRAFFSVRTAGEAEHEIMTGVMGKSDDFSSYSTYAGRMYADGATPEVAAIGIENIWNNPVSAAIKDPEWFNVVVSQLKGIVVR